MEPNGRFVMLRIADGVPVAVETLLPEESLKSIFVIASRNEYLLVTHQRHPAAIPNRVIQQAPGGLHAQLIYGRIYAFDRASGKPLWQVPARVDQYSIPLDQPSEIPVLTLLRQETVTRGNDRETSSAVIMIDKRDGRALFSQDQISTLIGRYQVSCDDVLDTVTLDLPHKSIVLHLTDDPTPPAPSVQTGNRDGLSTR